MRLLALGLAALASAQHPWSPKNKDQDVDLAADEERVYETFFDSVVIPARDAVKEKLAEPITVGASNASEIANLECAADALTTRIVKADRKIVIVGGGPAGLSAAVYAARADMAPLIVARDGGQLEGTSSVHNYPGFEDGVDAVELIQRLEKQAARFGADYKHCGIERVDLSCRPFKIYCEDGEVFTTGVHTCATCDGYFYRDRDVVVVGGGDTAMEQALFLARIANRVYVVHRKNSFRASSKAMATRVLKHPKILILWDTVISRFLAGDDGNLNAVELVTDPQGGTASETSLSVDGAFVAIGMNPNTELFTEVRKDEDGYIYTLPGSTVTSVTGVYAAGDVQDAVYRQAITSAGTGAMAAMDAERWLCEHGC
ncbi:thioredoxin-disulfide reductase [Aureococcus anophagefferens]|nr:thioredoxin-disulfide reductase [Aureococcus anophagefferens]